MNKKVSDAIQFVFELCGEPDSIDVIQLCNTFSIEIIDNFQLDKEGYLICSDGMKLIFINSRITNRHKKKFIIAHEIGHYLLHQSSLYCCSNVGENRSTKINSSLQEREANEFASELLLPKEAVSGIIPVGRIDFSTIKKIAEMYDVSVTMTAIKAMSCSKTEEEILICYENNRFKWFASSNKYIQFGQIPMKCPISENLIRSGIKTYGHWGSIYEGEVYQEVFSPNEKNRLFLLAGDKWAYYRSS